MICFQLDDARKDYHFAHRHQELYGSLRPRRGAAGNRETEFTVRDELYETIKTALDGWPML